MYTRRLDIYNSNTNLYNSYTIRTCKDTHFIIYTQKKALKYLDTMQKLLIFAAN